MDRKSAPGLMASDGDVKTVDWDVNQVTEIKKAACNKEKNNFVIEGKSLVDFVNADTNGVVVFYIEGNSRTHSFATKESTPKSLAPSLVLELAPLTTE